MSADDAAKAAWLAKLDAPTWGATTASYNDAPAAVHAMTSEEAAKQAWLAKLDAPAWGSVTPTGLQTSAVQSYEPPSFVHAPPSFFALDQLQPKGSRRSQGGLIDRGEPYDFSRSLVTDGDTTCGARVGSWACTPGGWDSPKLRPTTEVFLVLDGDGCVTDVDGMTHHFGAGDVVVLPKHWSGRWDIGAQIHKIWVVHDHPDVMGAADGIVRAVVAPVPTWVEMQPPQIVQYALHEAPANVAHTIYNVGPTRVGFVACPPGSFDVWERRTAEAFFVIDGVFFLTNPDGSSRRCTAGDTVVLPQGWSGRWDVVEPVRKVWVETGDRF